jgi:hypothetical protein
LKGILIRWGSEKDAKDAIWNTLFLIGAIVLCTLISIIRDQLSFFDGLFTLTVADSPIAWYILWINGRDLYFWIRRRDKAKQNAIPANPAVCLALVCGWISLNLVVWLKGRKFSNDSCGPMGFQDYFQSVVVFHSFPLQVTVLPDMVVIPLCGASYVIFCLRYYYKGKRRRLTNRLVAYKRALLLVQL